MIDFTSRKTLFPLPPGSMLASLKLNILRNGKFAMFAKNSNHGFIEQTLTPTLNRGEGGVENVNFPSRNRARCMSVKITGTYDFIRHHHKLYQKVSCTKIPGFFYIVQKFRDF